MLGICGSGTSHRGFPGFQPVSGGIERDTIKPAEKIQVLPETFKVPVCLYKRFLRHVIRVKPAACHAEREIIHGILVFVHKRGERLFVLAKDLFDYTDVFGIAFRIQPPAPSSTKYTIETTEKLHFSLANFACFAGLGCHCESEG